MSKYREIENGIRNFLNKEWKIDLKSKKVDINGKSKSFDLVDFEKGYYGDVKVYSNTKGGNVPSAKRSIANEYAFLLQKINNSKKLFLVFAGDINMVKKYYDDFKPWLEIPQKVHVYYYDNNKIIEIN